MFRASKPASYVHDFPAFSGVGFSHAYQKTPENTGFLRGTHPPIGSFRGQTRSRASALRYLGATENFFEVTTTAALDAFREFADSQADTQHRPESLFFRGNVGGVSPPGRQHKSHLVGR